MKLLLLSALVAFSLPGFSRDLGQDNCGNSAFEVASNLVQVHAEHYGYSASELSLKRDDYRNKVYIFSALIGSQEYEVEVSYKSTCLIYKAEVLSPTAN